MDSTFLIMSVLGWAKIFKITSRPGELPGMPDLGYCKIEPVFQTVLSDCPSRLIFWQEYIVLLFLKCLPSVAKKKEKKKEKKPTQNRKRGISYSHLLNCHGEPNPCWSRHKSELLPQSTAPCRPFLQRRFQDNSQWTKAVYKWEHWRF